MPKPQLTYAGVPLLVPTREAVRAARRLLALADPLAVAAGNGVQPYPALSVPRARPDRCGLGQLVWPTGASRFAFGHFLASRKQLEQVRVKLGLTPDPAKPPDPNADFGVVGRAAEFVLRSEQGTVRTDLYLLPPRPLSDLSGATSPGGEAVNDLWLITLVDERWRWRQRVTAVEAGGGAWRSAYEAVSDAGGLGVDVGDPDADPADTGDVDDPPEGMGTAPSVSYPAASPAAVLDALAYQAGQRVVRTLDGKVLVTNPETDAETSRANREDLDPKPRRVGGGRLRLGPPADRVEDAPLAVPQTVEVVFGTDPVPWDLAQSYDPADPATKPFERVKAGWTRSWSTTRARPADAAGYVRAFGEAWARRQWAAVHARYAGVVAWAPEGLSDRIVWTLRQGRCDTEVVRPPWDDGVSVLAAGEAAGTPDENYYRAAARLCTQAEPLADQFPTADPPESPPDAEWVNDWIKGCPERPDVTQPPAGAGPGGSLTTGGTVITKGAVTKPVPGSDGPPPPPADQTTPGRPVVAPDGTIQVPVGDATVTLTEGDPAAGCVYRSGGWWPSGHVRFRPFDQSSDLYGRGLAWVQPARLLASPWTSPKGGAIRQLGTLWYWLRQNKDRADPAADPDDYAAPVLKRGLIRFGVYDSDPDTRFPTTLLAQTVPIAFDENWPLSRGYGQLDGTAGGGGFPAFGLLLDPDGEYLESLPVRGDQMLWFAVAWCAESPDMADVDAWLAQGQANGKFLRPWLHVTGTGSPPPDNAFLTGTTTPAVAWEGGVHAGTRLPQTPVFGWVMDSFRDGTATPFNQGASGLVPRPVNNAIRSAFIPADPETDTAGLDLAYDKRWRGGLLPKRWPLRGSRLAIDVGPSADDDAALADGTLSAQEYYDKAPFAIPLIFARYSGWQEPGDGCLAIRWSACPGIDLPQRIRLVVSLPCGSLEILLDYQKSAPGVAGPDQFYAGQAECSGTAVYGRLRFLGYDPGNLQVLGDVSAGPNGAGAGFAFNVSQLNGGAVSCDPLAGLFSYPQPLAVPFLAACCPPDGGQVVAVAFAAAD